MDDMNILGICIVALFVGRVDSFVISSCTLSCVALTDDPISTGKVSDHENHIITLSWVPLLIILFPHWHCLWAVMLVSKV